MSLSKLTPDESGLSKWQIALLVGGTVFIGAGVYYFLIKNQKSSSKSKKGMKPKSSEEENSEDVLKNSMEDDPESIKSPLEKAQAYKNKGNKYFKGGKYEQAIDNYDRAIEICPVENKTDLSFFYQNRAAAYEQLKNWENVLRDCTAALGLNQRYIKALQRRAKVCEILKDLEQALEDLTAICIIEAFANQGTLVNVDRVLKDLGRQHAKEAMEVREPLMPSKHFIKNYFDSFVEDPITNSLYKEKEGDVDESEENHNKNAANNGYLLAKAHLQNNNYSDIIDCCSNELLNPLSPYRSEALLLKGTLHILRGQSKEAVDDLTELVELEDAPLKVKINALIKRGTLHMQHERVDECLKDFNKASLLDTTNSDVFHHKGQINLLLGNVDAAMADFKRSVELNSNFPIAFVQKCYTDYRYAHQMGDKAGEATVMAKFEEAIKNFPKCTECYVLYAQVLCDQNEFSKAEDYYLKAMEVDPENPTTLVHRALLILQWKGDLNTARGFIEKALQMDDQCELAYENLATIEVQTGNLKRGVELFEKAIPLAKTEMEMAHLFSLKDAAVAQLKVVERMGIQIPQMGELPMMETF